MSQGNSDDMSTTYPVFPLVGVTAGRHILTGRVTTLWWETVTGALLHRLCLVRHNLVDILPDLTSRWKPEFYNERMKTSINPQYSPYVLVTGGSSGIGRAVSENLASTGYTVYATSRHCREETEEFPGGGKIISRRMDVTDPESVQETVAKIPQLGIVVHCAGFGVAGSCEMMPLERARAQMETNYFGVLNVNNVVLPRLRENDKSLCVIIGSVAGFVGIPFQSHYSSSKYALEAYVECLRMEGKAFGLQAALVEPGDTKTEFTQMRTHDEPADSPYLEICERAVGQMAKDEQNGVPASKVAGVVAKVISRKHPPIRKVVGADYTMVYFLKRFLPNRLMEIALSRIYLG